MSHFTIEERLQIETLLAASMSIPKIAIQINRSDSSVYREVRRNSVDGEYCHNNAQRLASKRRAESKTAILSDVHWATVRVFLKQGWSPDQISGWLRNHPEFGFYVSDQWIYEYIHADREQGGDLYLHLRRKGEPYNKGGKKSYRGKIKNRISIDARPDIVEQRARLGDWEIDSVIGALHQSAIITLVERKSRYTSIIKVDSHDAATVAASVINRLRASELPLYSITGDNGNEFAHHEKISEELKIDFYFTDPYSSWQKGTNENTNGLIREYFPKGTDFNQISIELLQEVENALNSRPRKCLKYNAPAEVIIG